MLNKEQLQAVNHEHGSALIYAGPGSGKTTVITHHIKFLIDNKISDPKRILVISFSKASALELKNRFKSLDRINFNNISFGTFHSVFLKILKLYNSCPSNIIGEDQRNLIINKICNNSDLAERLKTSISYYKSYIDKNSVSLDESIINLIKDYNEMLIANDMIDFDDILINCYELITKNDRVRSDLQKLFSVILIDEFQDINEYQYEIIKLISNNNLYVVGDENQSIYSFRGAKPDIMNIFFKDFNNASIYNLNTNYRCHCDIIKSSQIVISHNQGRISDNIKAVHNDSGNHFEILISKTLEEEYNTLRNIISSINQDKTIGILLRTNKDVELYENVISEEMPNDKNIKYYINKVLFFYLDSCLYNTQESLLKILNVPNRFIPRNVIIENNLSSCINNKKLIYNDELTKLYRHLSILKSGTPQTFLLYLKNIVKLGSYFEAKFDILDKNKINNIFEEIRIDATGYSNLQEYYKYLTKFRDSENNKSIKRNSISIMTFHASKGLEFDVVIIPNLIEGVIPGRISIGNMNVEEERRLFYVAMTRAKEKLFLMTLQDENSMKYIPSRFLDGLLK